MKESIKSAFRRVNGYEDGHVCKNCMHCVRVQCGNRAHYKCREMGITASTATDIRANYMACKAFIWRVNGE